MPFTSFAGCKTKLSLALLDWEKAFDKTQHDKLTLALGRMGFSQHYRDVINDCYQNPTFFCKRCIWLIQF